MHLQYCFPVFILEMAVMFKLISTSTTCPVLLSAELSIIISRHSALLSVLCFMFDVSSFFIRGAHRGVLAERAPCSGVCL